MLGGAALVAGCARRRAAGQPATTAAGLDVRPAAAPAATVTSCADDLSGTWVSTDGRDLRYRIVDRGATLTIEPLFNTASQVAPVQPSAKGAAPQPGETLAAYSSAIYQLRRGGGTIAGTLSFTVTSTRGKTCPVSLTAQIDNCHGTIELWSDHGADVTWATCKYTAPGELSSVVLQRAR